MLKSLLLIKSMFRLDIRGSLIGTTEAFMDVYLHRQSKVIKKMLSNLFVLYNRMGKRRKGELAKPNFANIIL